MLPRTITNPINAQRSTGPRTAAGKARVALNPMTHGLLATQTVLADEDPALYAQFLQGLIDEYEPESVSERAAIGRLAHWQWKQWRAERAEAGFWDGQDFTTGSQSQGGAAAEGQTNEADGEKPAGETGPVATDSSQANARLAEAITARERQFSLLIRYGNSIARKLESALKEVKAMVDARIKAALMQVDTMKMEVATKEKCAALDKEQAVRRVGAGENVEDVLREPPMGSPAVKAAGGGKAGNCPRKTKPAPTPEGGWESLEEVDWEEVVQLVYIAVSAGPQSPHPLPETYHGAYAIWYKQSLMVAMDIGDDEAGSQIAAMTIALKMQAAGVIPKPGQVWGDPESLEAWRRCLKANEDPYAGWCAIVKREYGRRAAPKAAAKKEEEGMKRGA